MAEERFDEHRIRHAVPDGDATTPTRDPAEAGRKYREIRRQMTGQPGDLVIERRTITVGPWEERERMPLAGPSQEKSS